MSALYFTTALRAEGALTRFTGFSLHLLSTQHAADVGDGVLHANELIPHTHFKATARAAVGPEIIFEWVNHGSEVEVQARPELEGAVTDAVRSSEAE